MASGPKRILKPVLKNSSLKKSLADDKTKSSITLKGIKFNEDNIDATFHPDNKDYGLMKVPEIKTPYPRFEAPVSASILRSKLLQALSKKKTSSIVENPSDEDINSIGNPSLSSSSNISSGTETFEEKRKKFYASEYTLAQQRPLSNEFHPRAARLDNMSMYGSDYTDALAGQSSHRFSSTSARTTGTRRFSTAIARKSQSY